MSKQILVLLACMSGCYISQEAQAAADNAALGTVRRSLKSSKAIVRSLKPNTKGRKKKLSDQDSYDALGSAMGEISGRSSRLAIVDPIEQAHVWDDFKSVYQKMNLTGQEGLEQEKLKNFKKKLKDQKIDAFGFLSYRSYGSCGSLHCAKKYLEKEQKKTNNKRARHGFCGSLYYVRKHLEKEEKKADNTRAKQRILELI